MSANPFKPFDSLAASKLTVRDFAEKLLTSVHLDPVMVKKAADDLEMAQNIRLIQRGLQIYNILNNQSIDYPTPRIGDKDPQLLKDANQLLRTLIYARNTSSFPSTPEQQAAYQEASDSAINKGLNGLAYKYPEAESSLRASIYPQHPILAQFKKNAWEFAKNHKILSGIAIGFGTSTIVRLASVTAFSAAPPMLALSIGVGGFTGGVLAYAQVRQDDKKSAIKKAEAVIVGISKGIIGGFVGGLLFQELAAAYAHYMTPPPAVTVAATPDTSAVVNSSATVPVSAPVTAPVLAPVTAPNLAPVTTVDPVVAHTIQSHMETVGKETGQYLRDTVQTVNGDHIVTKEFVRLENGHVVGGERIVDGVKIDTTIVDTHAYSKLVVDAQGNSVDLNDASSCAKGFYTGTNGNSLDSIQNTLSLNYSSRNLGNTGYSGNLAGIMHFNGKSQVIVDKISGLMDWSRSYLTGHKADMTGRLGDLFVSHFKGSAGDLSTCEPVRTLYSNLVTTCNTTVVAAP